MRASLLLGLAAAGLGGYFVHAWALPAEGSSGTATAAVAQPVRQAVPAPAPATAVRAPALPAAALAASTAEERPVLAAADDLVEVSLPPEPSERDVDDFLEILFRRAAARSAITALEVEPGLLAIHRLYGRVDPARLNQKRLAFTARMTALADQQRGVGQNDPSLSPATQPRSSSR